MAVACQELNPILRNVASLVQAGMRRSELSSPFQTPQNRALRRRGLVCENGVQGLLIAIHSPSTFKDRAYCKINGLLGAQKSGTTSLFNCLCQHPQIVGSVPKEMFYLCSHPERGERWYRRHFPTIRSLQKTDAIEAFPQLGEAHVLACRQFAGVCFWKFAVPKHFLL